MGYHAGQLAVQERAGGSRTAEKLSRGMHAELPEPAQAFLAEQRLLVLGGADAGGRVWCSPLHGPVGFARALDARTLAIDARPQPGDPLGAALAAGAARVGLLAIEPQTRRRMRVNGVAEPVAGGLRIRPEQVFANCPKYIARREPAPIAARTRRVATRSELTPSDRSLIAEADTFFIATAGPSGRADASHRGGTPGFVRVTDERLSFGDYLGNSMYLTLGNLDADPASGLLFVDWESGATLQLSGRATIDWSPARAAAFPGAERVLDFAVERIVAIEGALPLGWSLVERSRFNPPA